MNVSQAYYIVNTLMKDKLGVQDLTKEEFNDFLLQTNNLYFNKLFKQKMSEANELQVSFEDYLAKDEDFRPLKTPATVALTAGSGTLPTNYVKYLAVSGTLSSIGRDIEVVSEKELNVRKYNVFGLLEYHPACVIKGTTIDVLPTSITSVSLTYIKEPTTPVYAETYNSTSGLNEYASGSSTQWDWNEHNHPDIVMEILNLLGISVPIEDVKKFIEK